MTTQLFRRSGMLSIETLGIPVGTDGLAVELDVKKSLGSKPNTAAFRVWNLSSNHRAELLSKAARKTKDGKPVGVRVRLDAGYVGNTWTIYEGDLRYVNIEVVGPDVIVNVESGDGEHIISRSKIFKSFAPGTPVADVIRDVARSLGIGEGNLTKATEGAALTGQGTTFSQGTTAAGKSVKELTRFCRSCGLEWSLQDGVLQILPSGKGLGGSAVVFSPETGLVGSPSLGTKNLVSARALLTPGVQPGRLVKIESDVYTGVIRVVDCRYTGESEGESWYVEVQGYPV